MVVKSIASVLAKQFMPRSISHANYLGHSNVLRVLKKYLLYLNFRLLYRIPCTVGCIEE